MEVERYHFETIHVLDGCDHYYVFLQMFTFIGLIPMMKKVHRLLSYIKSQVPTAGVSSQKFIVRCFKNGWLNPLQRSTMWLTQKLVFGKNKYLRSRTKNHLLWRIKLRNSCYQKIIRKETSSKYRKLWIRVLRFIGWRKTMNLRCKNSFQSNILRRENSYSKIFITTNRHEKILYGFWLHQA